MRHSFFQRLKKRVLLGANKNVFIMGSLKSESHIGNVTVSVTERPGEVPPATKTANEIAGYLSVLKPHQAVKNAWAQ